MLANVILNLHVLFILFVVAGGLLIIIGGVMKWAWVHNLKFRLLHLAAIFGVVLESWLGIACPLTVWEYQARWSAGQPQPSEAFIAYWLQYLFFFDAPAWVFTIAYTLFGLLVLLAWLYVPPRWPSRRH